MNKKNLWIAVFALLLSGTFASAQERQIKEEGRTEFKRHWFMQVQVGAAHTVGEAKFTDLISPAGARHKYRLSVCSRMGCPCGCQRMAGKR